MTETLIKKLDSQVLTLEITPPKSTDFTKTLDAVKSIKSLSKIDGITITDNPLAKLKYSAILASVKAQGELKKPVICTVSMRDKNKLAMQSELLGLNDFGVRSILALTGDPVTLSDQPNVKGVFEGNSTQLLMVVKLFNEGVDFSGKAITPKPKPMYAFSVTNSYSKNFPNIKKKLHKKIENYSCGIITQPVFDEGIAKQLMNGFDEVRNTFDDERKNAKLIFGVFPIVSLKTAQFLYSHVPGIYVPESFIDALLKASKVSVEEEYKVGMKLSREIYQKVKAINPRIHLMCANKFSMLDELLDG
jgi:methylenetetrahydrofolate reductase (NADPH)